MYTIIIIICLIHLIDETFSLFILYKLHLLSIHNNIGIVITLDGVT